MSLFSLGCIVVVFGFDLAKVFFDFECVAVVFDVGCAPRESIVA